MRAAAVAAVALAVLGGATASAAPRQTCLNPNRVWHDTDPVWSPTGEWIAFHRQLIGCDPAPNAVWIARRDGSGARQLIGARSYRPSWSPDGTRLVVEHETANGLRLEIHSVRAGVGAVIIPGQGLAATWSPLGDRIAYRGDFGNVIVYDIATGATTTVATFLTDWTPVAWSPDGTRLAYSVGVHLFAQSSHLEVVNADGTGRRRLTEPLPLSPDYRFDDQRPVWSPSGDLIAYESNRTGNWDVYTVRPDGTGQRNVTQNPAEDIRPAWRPGTNELSFISDRGEAPAPWGRRHSLYSLDLSTGAIRHLSHDVHPYGALAWSANGATVAFSSGRECERWGIYVSSEAGPVRISNRCQFRGTPRADRLVGTPFKDFLYGLGGNDLLRADAGDDLVDGGAGRNALYAGAGNDTLRARNGRRDLVDCGRGADTAFVDRNDRVRGCERVERR
jgi:Tol biopolymer transport system component